MWPVHTWPTGICFSFPYQMESIRIEIGPPEWLVTFAGLCDQLHMYSFNSCAVCKRFTLWMLYATMAPSIGRHCQQLGCGDNHVPIWTCMLCLKMNMYVCTCEPVLLSCDL